MAVRTVVKRYEMEVDPRKEFQHSFPTHFLPPEQDNDEATTPSCCRSIISSRQSMLRLWAQFTISVNDLCKTRRNRFINKNIRKAVFESGMENLCNSFSRRHVDIKIEWNKDGIKDTKTYRLLLVRLSDIPDSCQPIGQWFVAEIPPRQVIECETQAELVGVVVGATEPSSLVHRRSIRATADSDCTLVTVAVADENPVFAQVLSSTIIARPRTIRCDDNPDNDDTPPPFAFQVQLIASD